MLRSLISKVSLLWNLNNRSLKSRSISTDLLFKIRNGCSKDIDFATRQAVKEGWHIGPYDFKNAFAAFHQKGFFVGEVNKKPVGHSCAVVYPNSHSHCGSLILEDEHNGKGYAFELTAAGLNSCDKQYTIGADVLIGTKLEVWAERSGFDVHWDAHRVMLSANTAVQVLSQYTLGHMLVLPISSLSNSLNVLKYDSYIFGTPRYEFIKRWIATPGSFGFVALRDSNIVGYTILRQVVRNGGTEIGLAMAPLYADNIHIAKVLIKAAAEECLTNKAIPNTKLGLFHPVGEGCAEGSPELMEELEAEFFHVGLRVYTKGIPPGRKIDKIYGVASPIFD